MTIHKIVTLPDPVLRRKAHKITTFDKELQQLANDMVDTMREAPGVGLAAPQIGLPLRLIVVEFGAEEDETVPKKLYAIVNPEIVEKSDETVTGMEGCLSVPGMVGDVERHTRIVVKGLNLQGKPVKIKAINWLARIFQHEIDHLDGIVYTDLAKRVWQPSEQEKLEIME